MRLEIAPSDGPLSPTRHGAHSLKIARPPHFPSSLCSSVLTVCLPCGELEEQEQQARSEKLRCFASALFQHHYTVSSTVSATSTVQYSTQSEGHRLGLPAWSLPLSAVRYTGYSVVPSDPDRSPDLLCILYLSDHLRSPRLMRISPQSHHHHHHSVFPSRPCDSSPTNHRHLFPKRATCHSRNNLKPHPPNTRGQSSTTL